jgi:hypothetical protein
MSQDGEKKAICRICKTPLDLEICYSIIRANPGLNLEDILPGGQLDFLSWEACPNAGDDIHLKASLVRTINSLESCSICGHKIRSKYHYAWSDRPRTAEAIEELLGYQVHIKHVHHTSYNPERTMDVCDSCHAKIHHSDDTAYTQYRPKIPKRWYRVPKIEKPVRKGRVLSGHH